MPIPLKTWVAVEFGKEGKGSLCGAAGAFPESGGSGTGTTCGQYISLDAHLAALGSTAFFSDAVLLGVSPMQVGGWRHLLNGSDARPPTAAQLRAARPRCLTAAACAPGLPGPPAQANPGLVSYWNNLKVRRPEPACSGWSLRFDWVPAWQAPCC